jgi:ADP-ribose pyrophosphatase
MTDFNFDKKRWLTRKDKKVFETAIFDLHQIERAPDTGESSGEFYVLNAPEWINVIPLTPQRQIILVEQYRHGIDEVTLEIPGGMVDPGEEPLLSAQRELEEETGYSSNSWVSLGKVSSNPAILSNFTHLYLASNCRKTSEQSTSRFEDIAVHIIDLDRFLDYVRTGHIHHSIVVSAVAKFLLMEQEES